MKKLFIWENIRSALSLLAFGLFAYFSLSNFTYAEVNASVAAGSNHSLILKSNGSLWTMGKNDHGQLGNGNELERGLVGWWKFDGDATDSSGNGNDGTVNGAILGTDRFGEENRAYSFDGVNDWIETPSVNWGFDNTLTVSVWIKNEVNSAFGAPLSLGRTHQSDEILLGFRDNSSVEFYSHKSVANWARKEFSLDSQDWLNLVGVYNGGFSNEEILIYRNGEVQTSSYVIDGVPSLLSDITPRMLRIGARVTSSISQFFNGSIDDIRIYDRALSESEVSALYTLESSPHSYAPIRILDENVTAIAAGSETSYFIKNDGSLWGMGRNDRGQLGNAQGLNEGLVGWWKFDGDATDSSGNGSDGTVNGSILTTDRHGRANSAYSFDGVDDYISMTIGTYDEVTFSAWLNIASFDNEYPKLFDLGSSHPLFRIGFLGNRSDHVSAGIVGQMHSLRSSFSGHNSDLSYGIQPIGSWINVVTSLGVNSFHSIFLDGILIEQGSYKDSPSLDGELKIGTNYILEAIQFFNGSIDDVRIYNRALSESEVSTLYALESQPFDQFSPVKIVDGNVTAVSSRGSHALFQKTDGSLWAMGANDYGQLGDGTTTDRHTPVKIVDGNVTALSAGGDHSRFVQADGSLWGMGRNHAGQLGDGTTIDRLSPVKVVNSEVAEVASGLSHGYYLSTSGDLWSMGLNADGQLGDGTTINRNSPVQVLNGSTVSLVSAGSKEGFFTKSDGTTWAMGRNDFGQLGNGSTTDVTTPARLFTWKQNQSISKPRKVYSGAELLNGKIYLAGGFDGSSSADFESYDPNLDQWSSLPSLSEGLIGSMTGTLDGKIYSIGGATQVVNEGDGNLSGGSYYIFAIDGISDELLVIDPDTGDFAIVGDLGADFNSLSTMDYNPVEGKLYANAGYDLYSIDTASGVATKVGTMPRSSGIPSIAFHNDGRLFVHYEEGGPPLGNGYYYSDINFGDEVYLGTHSSFRNIFATELDGDGKIWSANQETAKLGRSNGTNYTSEWVGTDSILTHPLDLDITTDNKIFLMTTSWPSEVSDSTISRFSELNNITGGVSTSYVFTRGQLGSVASAPLSVVSKRLLPQSNVRFFDPVANNWNDGPSLPSAIHRGSIVSLSDRILILGGLDSENNRTGQTYELLSGSSGWTAKANMPTSRSATASVVADGKVWVIGGIDFSWSDKVEIFDPSLNIWESAPSLTSARVAPVAWVSSGIVFVAGGYSGSTYLDSIEMFDEETNSWVLVGSLLETIHQSDAVVFDNQVYFVGGENNTSSYPENSMSLNLSPLTSIDGGASHSLFVDQKKAFRGTGANESGQLGIGSTENTTYPIAVSNLNEVPELGSFSTELLNLMEDQNRSIDLNASDVDGDTITWSIVQTPTNGTAEINPSTGEFTYSPNANFYGNDVISIQVTDSELNASLDLNFTVTSVNDLPSDLRLVGDVLEIEENQPIGTLLGEFNATDIEGEQLMYSLIEGEGGEDNMLFTLDTNGTLTTKVVFDYESNASTYNVRLQVMDESNGTDAATFVVTLLDGENVQVFIEKTGEGSVIGAGSYDLNATAQVSATPAIGYLFNSWSGDFNSTEMEEQFIVDKNYSFVANFTKDLSDNDGDELTNYFELVEFGSDPNSADSDEDGFSDFEENKTGLNPNLANHNFRALWNEKINEASSQGITDGVNWITHNRSQHDLNTTADIQYELGYADGYSETLADLKLANELDYNASILQAAKDREDLVKSELENGVNGLIYLDQLRQNAQPYAQNWYYQPELGWLWTRPDIYPLVYFADTNNSLGSRWLYSVKLGAIEDGSYFDFEADKIIKTKE